VRQNSCCVQNTQNLHPIDLLTTIHLGSNWHETFWQVVVWLLNSFFDPCSISNRWWQFISNDSSQAMAAKSCLVYCHFYAVFLYFIWFKSIWCHVSLQVVWMASNNLSTLITLLQLDVVWYKVYNWNTGIKYSTVQLQLHTCVWFFMWYHLFL